jgi:predicted ATPase
MSFADKGFITEMRWRGDPPQSDEYPLNIRALRDLESIRFNRRMTCFVGENATGKSTLLEAISVCLNLNPEGGTRGTQFATRSTHSPLSEQIKLIRGIRKPQEMFFLRAESFYNLASYIDEVGAQHSYGGTSLHRMSHGESFLNTLVNRLSGRGLYLLDEPERDFFMSHAAIVESMMQASDLDAADHKQ